MQSSSDACCVIVWDAVFVTEWTFVHGEHIFIYAWHFLSIASGKLEVRCKFCTCCFEALCPKQVHMKVWPLKVRPVQTKDRDRMSFAWDTATIQALQCMNQQLTACMSMGCHPLWLRQEQHSQPSQLLLTLMWRTSSCYMGHDLFSDERDNNSHLETHTRGIHVFLQCMKRMWWTYNYRRAHGSSFSDPSRWALTTILSMWLPAPSTPPHPHGLWSFVMYYSPEESNWAPAEWVQPPHRSACTLPETCSILALRGTGWTAERS